MSKARDIANLFSSNTAASTDAEVTAAIAAHNNATSSVHGISNTASLATQDFVLLNKGVPSGTTAQRPVNFLSSTGDVYSNTSTGYMEIYNSTYGWEKVGANPSNLVVTPTNVGTGRAFNNGAVEVDLGMPSVPGRTYTITSTPTTTTYTANTAYAIFDGLQSSTQYTFTATATNLYGSSTPVTSSLVTVTTVPDAPTIGTAVAGNNTVTVSWTPGATGGSAITGYSVYPFINGVPQNPTSVPNVTSAGISATNGTAYTFKVAAINANGMSQLSSASSSVTPSAGVTIEYLVVAGGGGGGRGANEGYGGGGGGAGGYRSSSSTFSLGTAYTITVGNGGTGGSGNYASNMTNGGNSSISGTGVSYSATGGGAGATVFGQGSTGGSGGGSGGHYSGSAPSGGIGNAGGYTPVEGYNGGAGQSGGQAGAGGGGGAGGVGAAATTSTGGVGSNAHSTWATATSSGVSGYYAGGGGGGGSAGSGAGGSGGGGAGQNGGTSASGTTNTGGGGGGNGNGTAGGSGGSGIVILRYNGSINASATTGSPSRYETGGYTYYKFTGNGSITF